MFFPILRDVKLFGQKLRIQQAVKRDAGNHRKPLTEIPHKPEKPLIRQAVSPSSAIADLNANLVEQANYKQVIALLTK